MCLLLVEDLHDIAPPVDYSLLPPGLIFGGSCVVLALLGLIGWWMVRRRRRPVPAESACARALSQLQHAAAEIDALTPYTFSIRVSDVLRGYVQEQFQLPSTRQTSVEFLGSLKQSSSFTEADKWLLGEFLQRCDLIKFARYEATTEDSRRLLEEATRFVRGGQLEAA